MSAVALEQRFDLAAHAFDPAPAVRVRNQGIGLAAVVARGPQGRKNKLTGPARYRPNGVKPFIGPKGAADDHPRTRHDHTVDRDRLAVEQPHLPQRARHREDMFDELGLAVVPAQREDLGAIAGAEMRNDIRQAFTRDGHPDDSHRTCPSIKLKWIADSVDGPGAALTSSAAICVP